jgi:hypothetical protein
VFVELRDIRSWRIQDAIDQARERFICVGLFVAKFPEIVDAAHTADFMCQATLGDVGIDAGPAHQGPGYAAAIVQSPPNGVELFSQGLARS